MYRRKMKIKWWIYDLMIAQYSTVLDRPLRYSIVSLSQLFLNCRQFGFFFLFQRILKILVSRMTWSCEKENFLVGCGVLFLYFTPCCHRVLALVRSPDRTVHTGKNHLWFNVYFSWHVFIFWTDHFSLGCFVSLRGNTHFQERNVSKIWFIAFYSCVGIFSFRRQQRSVLLMSPLIRLLILHMQGWYNGNAGVGLSSRKRRKFRRVELIN